MVNGVKTGHRRRRSPAFIILTTVLSALFLVALSFLIIYMSGIRYLVMDTGSDSYIKFFGRVDSDGHPVSGNLYYSDGLSAKIDIKSSTVEYSNGAVYEGMLTNLQRNGKGTITFSNGDIYTGMFLNDKITGKGTYTFSNGDT